MSTNSEKQIIQISQSEDSTNQEVVPERVGIESQTAAPIKQRKKYVKMTEEKINIIKNLVQQGTNTKDIADVVDMSPRSVQRWIQKIQKEESLQSKKRGQKKATKESLREEIEMIVNDDCSLTLQGIADNLANQPIVSRSKICRELKEMGYSRKRIKIMVEKSNSAEVIEERFIYSVHLTNIQDGSIVYLDETGFNLHTSYHFGYAPVGANAIQTVPTNRGRNLSVLVAITVHGVLSFGMQQNAYNTESMLEWINEFFIPYIENKNPIVIMDNARFHHANVVRNTLTNAGCNVLYLPPYSPQLNPIEEVFSMVKARYRIIKPRPATLDEMMRNIEEILISLTNYDMTNFFLHSREWIEKARLKSHFA